MSSPEDTFISMGQIWTHDRTGVKFQVMAVSVPPTRCYLVQENGGKNQIWRKNINVRKFFTLSETEQVSVPRLVDIGEILCDNCGNSWPKFAILDDVGLACSTRFCKFLVERELVRTGKIQEIRRWRLTECER